MDKVDSSASSLLNLPFHPDMKLDTKKAKDKGDLSLRRRTFFSQMLDSSSQAGDLGPLRELAPSEEALTELMDAVHSAGSDLVERPFPDEILRYKRAVRNFINYVIENGYELEKNHGIKKKVIVRGETEWKSKIYSQIKVVDQKLEELAAAILSGQADKLNRISKLDEVTGMLVDLTVTGMIKERDE